MAIMLRRAGTIALVIFELIWLNVIIPGHTRGAVTIPCTCSAQASNLAACPFCNAAAGEKAGRSHHAPTPTDREHCALCFFAAHLSIPPALDSFAPELLFLNYVRPEMANHLIAREVLVPFYGRAPPHSA